MMEAIDQFTGLFSYIFQMISSGLDIGVFSRTTTLVKSISLAQGKCRHTNIIRLLRIQNETSSQAPQIVSSTSEKQGQSLKRKTEIQFNRIKYIIEDKYQFLGDPSLPLQKKQEKASISSSNGNGNSNQPNSRQPTKIRRNKKKKICLFQKIYRNEKKFAKRNTKNIPKNFCKAFEKYMEGIPKTPEVGLAVSDFKKLQRNCKYKYNNNLMRRLLSYQRIRAYFKQFLENYASDWINSSKIADKEVHIEAIQIYNKQLNNIAYAQVDPSNPSNE